MQPGLRLKQIWAARLLPLLIVGCAGMLRADDLTFANGERLTGKLIAVQSNVVHFQSDSLGLLHIPNAAGLSLSVLSTVIAKTTDGKQYEGTLRAGKGIVLAVDDNTQMMSLAPNVIVSIKPVAGGDALPSAVEATYSREPIWEGVKGRPRIAGPWSVDTRFALSGVRASKDRRLIHWTGEVVNATRAGQVKLNSERVYSVSTNEAGKHFVDDDLTQGELNYSKSVSERSSGFVDFSGLHDAVRYIDKRLNLSGGGQYLVVSNRRATVTASIGPAWIHYSYLENKGVITPEVSFAALQVGYKTVFHLPQHFTVHHDFTFDQGHIGDGSYLSSADVKVRRPVTSWLYVDSKFSDDFDRKAANQASENTFRYSAGLGVNLGSF